MAGIRRALGCGWAVLCLVALMTAESASYAAAANRVRLRDGFVVAPGSELVGTVFPRIAYSNPAFEGWSGWTAVLDVKGQAGAVFDEYAAQARQHGLDVAFSDESCQEPMAGDVVCSGYANAGDVQIEMSLRVCTICRTPIATATVNLLSQQRKPEFGPALDGDPPSPHFAAQLDAELRRQMTGALPKTRETIPFQPDAYETAAGPKSPLVVASGSKAIASAKRPCLDGGSTTVMWSNRSVSDAFAQYRAQVRSQSNNGAPTTARRAVDGREVGAINGSYAIVNLVAGAGGTWVLAEQCFAG